MSEEFDVVYAHLSLHYFSREKTKEIVKDIHRVLKQWWIFAILLNTIEDSECGEGEKLEDDYYMIRSVPKRYFSVSSAREVFSSGFETVLLDNQGETYKDREKWIHNLIRFVWRKI